MAAVTLWRPGHMVAELRRGLGRRRDSKSNWKVETVVAVAELVSSRTLYSRRGVCCIRRGEGKYPVNAAPRVGTERESPTERNAQD
jgi:hypothetical protein